MGDKVFWIDIFVWGMYFWLSALSFHYFPWSERELCWWYLPHLITVILSGVGLCKICVLIDEYYSEIARQKFLKEKENEDS